MVPNIVIFGKEISSYMILALLGILLTLWVTYREAQKAGIDEVEMLSLMLFAFGGGFIGSHLLYGGLNYALIAKVIAQWSQIQSVGHFFKLLQAIFGGAVWYGGLLGGLLTGFLYLRCKKQANAFFVDIAALAIPLFHTFGRLGCFFSGCCYGVESRFGFVYHHNPISDANGVVRFPVQLVEAVLNLALFFVLFVLHRRHKAKGFILPIYLLVYPCYRFVLEFFRGDTYRGIFNGLSTSQWISIGLFACTAMYTVIQLCKTKKTKPE